jgi:hypothetical protein
VLQCRAQFRSPCARDEESDQCVAFCAEIGHIVEDFVPGCNDERVSWQNCVNATAPGAANWNCSYEDDVGIYGEGPQAVACMAQQDAYSNCLLTGEGS